MRQQNLLVDMTLALPATAVTFSWVLSVFVPAIHFKNYRDTVRAGELLGGCHIGSCLVSLWATNW